MSKLLLVRLTVLVTLMSGMLLEATTQFRSPISVERGTIHYPFDYTCDTWWYDVMFPNKERECYWMVDKWLSAYYSCASKTFFDDCDPCTNKTTAKTAPLSVLWFGKESFVAEEAFAGGIITDPLLAGYTPFLSFSTITPEFNYTEKGAIFGLHAEGKVGTSRNWRLGGRVSLPFKIITIEHPSCNNIEQGLDQVCIERPMNLASGILTNENDFICRLDLLSVLVRPAIPVSDSRLLVEYGDGSGSATTGVTRIAGVPIGSNTNVANTFPPDMYAIKGSSGVPALEQLPGPGGFPAWAKHFSQADGILAADGSGAEANTFFFSGAVGNNYLANLATNRAAQATLWIVPRMQYDTGDVATGNPIGISANALAIHNAIRDILDNLDDAETALEFLARNGVDLCKAERILGLGDLLTEFYAGYGPDNWFVWLVAGARFPTGKKQDDARRVYYQTPGHNGHFEARAGLEGGWNPCRWFAFRLGGFYNHAFKATEKKAAPFKGATIKNIGPNVDAKVSWDYFTANLDLNFIHPNNPEVGCVLGYEFFAKRKDHVCLCSTTAVDFLNRTRELDATILETNTNAMTHKIRGEVYHRWNYFELFAGASHAVAGKNAMQESEVHIGFSLYF